VKIIQLSDLHLVGKNKTSLYGIDPNLRLKLALDSIEKNHANAEFVVITGDLTDNASPEAYESLASMIDGYNLPIYLMLGNHDKREIFKRYFPQFIDDNFAQYIKKIDNKVHIFLDTLVENCSYGELCITRMAWLKKQLDIYADDFIYLYMHHHPIESGLYEMDNDADFKSTNEFWKLLDSYNNIKHISFGHLHRIMHSVKCGISLHGTRSTTFQVAYQPDSKVEFLTNEENPTYAVLEILNDNNTRIHHHEFMNEDRFYKGDY
jgi:3',5'-cyclic AMP phosphodiesterase CpdA